MTRTLQTSILPSNHIFAKVADSKHELDLRAICIFIATGFFLDDDTYYKDQKCLLPGHNYVINEKNFIQSKSINFKWHYSPENRSFNSFLEEYIALLSEVIEEQTKYSEVILPLSGGLDSRSQAQILSQLNREVSGFSYSFDGGYNEHLIAEQIASACNFNFQAFKIKKGYLWDSIDELAKMNNCYSEFTHQRQMAVFNELKLKKGIFSLGHWGDVLFDRGVKTAMINLDLESYVFKLIVKPAGIDLAEKLWSIWGLEGTVKDYLQDRVALILSTIDIDNPSAKVRAFKTTQWAHRWTTTNLSVFRNVHDISLPYYDDRMLKFICKVPELFLADRKLQIAHLLKDDSLAKITWQDQKPFNLKNYKYNIFPYNLPYRVYNKGSREFNSCFGRHYVQRNWEIQFVGSKNENSLEKYLYNNTFLEWVPKKIIDEFYNAFKYLDSVKYAHAVSMLLTLSKWYQSLRLHPFDEFKIQS